MSNPGGVTETLLASAWAPRVPEWEGAALWVAFAFFALLGLVLCRRQLIRFSLGRVWALARTEFCRAWRHKLWWLIPAWLLMLIGMGAYIRSPSPLDRMPQAIEQVLGTQTILPLLGLLVWTATALPGDSRSGVLSLNLTKPATPLEQITGRAIGVSLMAALLVGCFYVIGLVYLNIHADWMLVDARKKLARQEAAYAADPSVVNFPNLNLKRVVSEGMLVSLRNIRPLVGDPSEERRTQGDGAPPPNRHELESRRRRADRRMNVGAVEANTESKIWIRGGTRNRAVFHFPELVQVGSRSPVVFISFDVRWVVGTKMLPRLAVLKDGNRPPVSEIEVELEFRSNLGKGLKRERAKLSGNGTLRVPIRRRSGLLTNQRNRYGPLTINVICASKEPIALGLRAGSIAIYGVVELASDGRPRAIKPTKLLAFPYVKLRDVDGCCWIRGEGRKLASGHFLPSGDIAWFDFPAIDPGQMAELETVPLRIMCRALAWRNLRDEATGEMLPTEARVIVVPHNREYGPVGEVPKSAFTKIFTASQVGDHWVHVDRDVLANGPVRVFVQCMTNGHAVGLTDESVQFVLGREPFAVNLLRAEGIVLIHLVSVIILASVWGSLLNRSLAIWGSASWYVVGLVAPLIAHTILFDPYFGKVGSHAFSLILRLMPQYGNMNASLLVMHSRAIDVSILGQHFMAVAGYGLCHILLGSAILERREVH